MKIIFQKREKKIIIKKKIIPKIGMTRFARRGGFTEKKEIRKKEEATVWKEMFNKSDSENEINEDKNEEEKKRKHAEDYDKRIEAENQNTSKRIRKEENRNSGNDDRFKSLIAEFSKSIDKEVLEDFEQLRKKAKMSDEEYLDRLRREARSNQRRLDRQNEREYSKACFKCRKTGHSINDCPEIKRDSEQGTGICYKCGSTEHSVHACKVKLEPGIQFDN